MFFLFMIFSEFSFREFLKKRPLDAFLFDLDGTLLDSREGIIETVYTFLKSKGIPSNKKKIATLFGTPIEELFRVFMPSYTEEQIKEFVSEIREIYAKNHLELVRIFPGVKQLLSSLKRANYKIGLASTKYKPFIMEALEHFKFANFFDVIASGYEVKNHKPAPDLLFYAAKLLGVPPEKCIYIGDSQTDVLAGKAAKMATILVSTNNYPETLVKKLNPDFVVSSIDSLLNYFR